MAKTVSLGEDYMVAGNIVPVAFDSGAWAIILVPTDVAGSPEEAAHWVADTLNGLAVSGERVTVEQVHEHVIGDGHTGLATVDVAHEHGPEPGSE